MSLPSINESSIFLAKLLKLSSSEEAVLELGMYIPAIATIKQKLKLPELISSKLQSKKQSSYLVDKGRSKGEYLGADHPSATV